MKVNVPSDLGNVTDPEVYQRFSAQALAQISQAVNGNLQIGDNIRVFEQTYVSPGDTSVPIEIKHGLGTTNTRWIITNKFNAADFYRTGVPAPDSFSIICTAGISTFTIMVFA